jgi:hypothetical protein
MGFQRTEAEIAEEVRFIRGETAWPFWPWLTVKRTDDNDKMQVGAIYAFSTTTVIDINFYGMTKEGLTAAERFSYDSVEDLVADGWVVD